MRVIDRDKRARRKRLLREVALNLICALGYVAWGGMMVCGLSRLLNHLGLPWPAVSLWDSTMLFILLFGLILILRRTTR